jgi:type I restriction enzyme M protein
MITSELKSKIDKIWGDMWAGGIANPLTVIEQLTYLMFIKMLDDRELENEAEEVVLGVSLPRIFPLNKQHLRWSDFKNKESQIMYQIVQQEVFPFIKELNANKDSAYSKFMKDAMFIIPTPLLLEKVVTGISDLPLKDRDLKGDIYEYMLGKIQSSGQNGQFRTPRHIIKMMVELMKPTPEDIICDPACGTAGFLLGASNYLMDNHPELLFDKELKEHYLTEMFHGYDTDQTMLRIAAMNMMLHNVEQPDIEYRDSLSSQNTDRSRYTLILANPPFTGSLDYEGVASDLLAISKTKKTELLFLSLFIKALKMGGRCASIVPDGVLFGSSKAHKDLRQELVEHQHLVGIISMPSGVFKPYAGVSTAIVIFTKTGAGGTSDVWFYDMQADGFSLDDKRNEIPENDIPDIIERFRNRENEKGNERNGKCFFVSKEEIVANGYDLSINKYKKIDYEEEQYEHPTEILEQIKELEEQIMSGIRELEDMIR